MDKSATQLLMSGASLDVISESVDLTRIHTIACIIGAILCVYVMQLFSRGAVHVDGECTLSFYIRRAAMVMLALAMCWAATYSTNKGWQPWPPDVLIVCATDLMLVASLVVAARRRRAFG